MTDSSAATTLQQLLSRSVSNGTLRSAVFSRPRSATCPHNRVDVRSVLMRGGVHLQFTTQTGPQQTHRNLRPAEAAVELTRLAAEVYRDIRLVTVAGVWEARFSKKNDCLLKQVSAQAPDTDQPPRQSSVRDDATDVCPAAPPESHNRARAYLIPDGVPCPFLVHTGVMTPAGQVRTRHYHKFRQINRYLEFIHDLLGQFPIDQPLQIVDFGCGKSYLTFATHYLLTEVCRRPCRITGLDRREDVVRTCQQIVDALQLSGIEFQVGQIAAYQPAGPVHLTISLHACDTATDDALFQAIQWDSQVILAVPCCQHELSSRIDRTALPLITGHGILKEQFASLATDAMRAAALNAAGYDAQVMEFIELEHTPKNLLIRAIRQTAAASESAGSATAATSLSQRTQTAWQQLQDLRRQLNVPPLRLESLLIRSGLLPGTTSRQSVDPQ